MSEPDATQPPLRAAEDVLSQRLGGTVRLGEAEALDGTVTRSRVMRCRVREAPGGAPVTVILKRFFGPAGSVYDPADWEHSCPAWLRFNEWTVLLFLDRR